MEYKYKIDVANIEPSHNLVTTVTRFYDDHHTM